MANTVVTPPRTEREHFLANFERESETTLRVLKNFPPDKIDWKPTDRSVPAKNIAWILVIGQHVTEPVLTLPKIELSDAPRMQPPADWKQMVSAYEQAHRDATKRLTAMSEETFQQPFTMPSGPNGATVTFRRADALWMFFYDSIHHRGQFTVYLRAAGGKVPSIYGGSEAEPWS